MRKDTPSISRASSITLIAMIGAMSIITELFLVEHAPPHGISDWKAIRLAEQAISNLYRSKIRRSYSSFVVRDSRPGKIVVYVAPRPERDGGNCTVTMTAQGKILDIDNTDL